MASLKTTVWNSVLRNPESEVAWTLAFAHSKLTLFIPPGKKNFKQKSAVVKQRIDAFKRGHFEDLWHQATRQTRGRRPEPPAPSSVNIRRATMLAEEGQYGKAAKALTSHGLDFDSHEAIVNMRAKHPFSPPPPPLPPPSSAPYSFNSAEVLEALKSFDTLSAGGPTGEKPTHLKDCVNSDRGNTLLNTLTRVVNMLAAGKIPNVVAPFLCGGNLFAALKKCGGHRPIAVGEALRRLTAKCVSRKATADVKDILLPLQLGVGVKSGAEAIIHATNAIFHDDSIPTSDKWTLLLDFSNAFNSIKRDCVIEAVRQHCPKAALWVESCYGQASHLHFGGITIESSTGVQQGDPLASLLFALVLLSLLLRLKADCSDLLHVFYLDDGTLCGKREVLQRAFDLIRTEGPAIGLVLNPAKSLIWCGSEVPEGVDSLDPLDRGIPRAPAGGFSLLGAPIGDIPFSRDTVDERIEKIAAIFDVLPSLNNAQIGFGLLRYCYSLPKLSYCLRTCNPTHLLSAYTHFDSLQTESLSLLLGRSLDSNAKIQAFLPVKIGGVGLRSAAQHASAAFIASIAESKHIVDALLPNHVTRRSSSSAFPLLQEATGNPSYTDVDLLPENFRQHTLSVEIDSHTHAQLTAAADARNSARFHSLALPHAGDWVDANPSPHHNLNIDSRSFAAAMGYRLGLPLMEASECRSPLCDRQQDESGDHAMHCRDDNGVRTGRHDRIRDQIFSECQQASLSPSKEAPGLIPGSLSRPADIFVPQFTDGRKIAFDVSVVSPTQDALIHHAAQTPAAAIESRKASKNRDHFDACHAQGIFFQPLVVETFGGWDRQAVNFLKKMATQCAHRWGKTSSIEIKQFFQRLSVALQRGNASLLIDRDTPRNV